MTEHDQNIEDQAQDDQISDPTKEDQISDPAPEDLDQETDLDQTDTEEQTEQDSEQDSEQAEQGPDPRITSARKEAAKYRKRAQEAESERDSALDIARAAVSSVVRAHLEMTGINPDLLWTAGHSPAEFLDVDDESGGFVNFHRVNQAVADFEAKTGMRTDRNGRPGMLKGSPGMTGPPPSTGSWSDALRG